MKRTVELYVTGPATKETYTLEFEVSSGTEWYGEDLDGNRGIPCIECSGVECLNWDELNPLDDALLDEISFYDAAWEQYCRECP